jgi:hypothetical protein
MSMLSRYRKLGGFVQLLQLIETCGKQKQDNFLQIIEKEDIEWANTIRKKMLTLEKVLGFDNSTLAEISARLQDLTLATALHGFKPEDGERFLTTFTHTQKRNIEDLKTAKVPLPAEINAAFIKILVEVRSMITQGYIRLEKVAPDLMIPEGIEDKIGKAPAASQADNDNVFHIEYEGTGSAASASSHSHATHSDQRNHGAPDHDAAETGALRAKLQAIANENYQLKTELKILREKLAQIKKIA